jgi:flagellar biosynthesis/type III secretory pathway M-ring protein FliF/YscJ
MPTFLAEMLSQVKAIWARLDAGQRLTIVAVLVATLAGLGAIVWFAGRPDYQEVFSSDDQRTLSEARTALSSASWRCLVMSLR